MATYQTFAGVLNEICETHHISTRKLAQYSGSSASTIHRVLRLKAAPTLVDSLKPRLINAIPKLLSDLGVKQSLISVYLEHLNQEETSMLADRCVLSPDAIRFFGLRCDPFDVDRLPSEDEIFSNKELDAVSAKVADAVLYQRFVAVIGPVGSGKTLLKLRVSEMLSNKAKLLFPEFFDASQITVAGIANKILFELGQRIPRNKEARVSLIRDVLTYMQQDGVPVAIMLDECHRLDDKVISSLKNFWELTNGHNSRLLGVVLFGQPSFVESRLRDTIFKEIRQRVQIIQMPSINKFAADYIRHRIKFAGGNPDNIFDSAAIKRIAINSPTPLVAGNLTNQALMDAYNVEEKQVTVSLSDTLKRLPSTNGSNLISARKFNQTM